MAQIPSYNKIDYQNDSKLVVYAKQQAIAKAVSKTSPAIAAKTNTSDLVKNQPGSTRYEIPEYNGIDYKNDSLAVIDAKRRAIAKAQGAFLPITKTSNAANVVNTNATAQKTSAARYETPNYNKIDYANDSLAVIQAKRLAIANAQGGNGKDTTPTVTMSADTKSITIISPQSNNKVKESEAKKSTDTEAKEKAQKLKEAEERKKKLDKEFQEKTTLAQKNSEEAIKNVEKYIAEQGKASTEKKDQVVSSSEALKEMKGSVKNMWKEIVSPLSGSLSDAVNDIKSDEAAKGIIGEIKETAQGIGKIKDLIKDAKGLSKDDLLKLSTKSLLELQKDI